MIGRRWFQKFVSEVNISKKKYEITLIDKRTYDKKDFNKGFDRRPEHYYIKQSNIPFNFNMSESHFKLGCVIDIY